MNRCIEFAYKMYKQRYEINLKGITKIKVVICKTQEELLKKRIKMTKYKEAKEALIREVEKHRDADGCFVVPPNKGKYTILLVKQGSLEMLAYNYCHELTHILNYNEYIKKQINSEPLSPYKNIAFQLWDEYSARYASTMVLIDWNTLEEMQNGMDEVVKWFYGMIECFKKRIIDDNYLTYDGMQFLGFVSAFYDQQIISTQEIENILSSDNAKNTFVYCRNTEGVNEFI